MPKTLLTALILALFAGCGGGDDKPEVRADDDYRAAGLDEKLIEFWNQLDDEGRADQCEPFGTFGWELAFDETFTADQVDQIRTLLEMSC